MEADKYVVNHIPIKEIFADPEFNCRGSISALNVVDLSTDIKNNGLHSPIIVQPMPPDDKGHKWRIIAGHRRHKACLVAEFETIPAFIRSDLSDMDARLLNLAENIKRQDLNIVEESQALKKLMDYGMTQPQMAEKLSATRGWVQVRCMLLSLPPDILEEARLGNVSQQMIRDLYTIKKNGGNYDDMTALVRAHKNSKSSGCSSKKMNVRVGKKDAKRIRNLSEMLILQDLLYDNFGACLATRATAWTAGQINDSEMIATIVETCEKTGRVPKLPEDGCILRITTVIEHMQGEDVL
jgi:ParB family chromosome partitioning protein